MVHGRSTRDSTPWSISCDKLVLAAGALNTSRITLNSLEGKKRRKLTLHTRGSFIVPVLSIRPIPIGSNQVNSLPSIFIETIPSGMEDWVHIQLGLDNELLKMRLDSFFRYFRIPEAARKIIKKRLIVGFVNYDSKHSSFYKISHTKSGAHHDAGSLHVKYMRVKPRLSIRISLYTRLLQIFASIKCLPILPLAQLNKSTYHVGASPYDKRT